MSISKHILCFVNNTGKTPPDHFLQFVTTLQHHTQLLIALMGQVSIFDKSFKDHFIRRNRLSLFKQELILLCLQIVTGSR